jgi:hypothetical protein
MKKTLALLLTALPLLCGCEYDFPLKSAGDEDRLTVVAAVNEDGTMFVDVETTVPINKYADGDKADTSLTKLELSVNGRPCALVRQDSLYKESSLSGNRFWKTVEPIRPGDEVEIAAKGASTKEVRSTFTMPSAPVISSIESGVHVSELSDLADYGLFDVRVKSQYFKVRIADASDEDYYGIRLLRERNSTFIYENGEVDNTTQTSYEDIQDSESGSSAIQYGTNRFFCADYDGITANRYTYPNGTYLFPGSILRDGAVEFISYYYPSGDFKREQSYWEQDPDTGEYHEYKVKYRLIEKISYRIQLYKVSPELYHYCRSLYMIDNNLFAEVGLSPSNFSYTNITGGFGVLGGLSATQSDWIRVPVETE